MKKTIRLLGLLVALHSWSAAQQVYNPPVRWQSGTAAPSSGTCDAAGELGGIYLQTGNPASVRTQNFVCTQTGASSYGWMPFYGKIQDAAPATCGVGDLWFDSNATAGSNVYGCTATDTWTLQSGGGGGTGDEATAVTIPDGATPTLTATSNTVQTFTKTATASVTSCTLASLTVGQLVILQWTQDGTGGWDFACAGFVGLGEVDTTMDVACVQTFRATSSSAAIAVGGMVCDGDPLNLIPGSGGTTATFPAGTITVTQTIASGTKSLATAEIASEACTSAQTDTATGAATTDAIVWSFDADVTGVTGYAPLSAGGLILYVYPTSDTFNVKVCNPTADPITPGAVDLNWRILR